MTVPTKPLCKGAWAIPPTPQMKAHGNDYFTCSLCGEPTDAPDRDTDVTINTPGQEAILYFLKQLVAKHYDEDLGTYDYDGIAEEVLSYVN